ncbi:MAG TPA: hypothetical protein VF519_00730 [Mycobacteriales bacterium]|jgi:hypothetical protein
MSRRLLAVLLAAAALAPAAPASAAVTPGCDDPVDVACNEAWCGPDYACTPVICLVFVRGRCVV